MASTKMNREAWLNRVAEKIAPRINNITGNMTPKFRVSVGFPSKNALSSKRRTIGQCFSELVSPEGVHELFISPVVGVKKGMSEHDCSIDAAGVLAHELCHANVGVDARHGKKFKDAAYGIGLKGKATATVVGEEFAEFIDPIIKKLGPYPHAAMVLDGKHKPQATKLIKVWCPSCHYTIRVTQKWIDVGFPTCPCGEEMDEA